jgi:hypothetical protein
MASMKGPTEGRVGRGAYTRKETEMKKTTKSIILVVVMLAAALLIAGPVSATPPSCEWNHGACVNACKDSPVPYGCGGLTPSQRASCCAAACNDGACYFKHGCFGPVCPAPLVCGVDFQCPSDQVCVSNACQPCPGGQHVSGGQCVADVCGEDFQCQTGEHCDDNVCAPDACGVDFQCPTGQHCSGNECVADVCGVDFQCGEGYHCEGNACVENPPLACGVDFFCEEGFHCFENECVPDACGVDYCTEQGYHCEGAECVENPPPTCDPVCGDNAYCEGTTCACDGGYHMNEDLQCVENPQCESNADCPEGQECVDGACETPAPSGIVASDGVDDGRVDGDGFVLWDRLITLADRDEGYYWHAFNETEAWIRIDGPGSFNESFFVVQSSYARSAHGSGSYPADAPGEWTIVLLGTNAVDSPTEPRVLAACHVRVEPLALTGFGVQHEVVERTRNYVEG